ncbi:hypothetical protein GGI12_002578 [Dipsacomyces acuminosporus]|nr:hypothetical protein GGI12_002578 [Dipsacomyces acuminosporus]
MNSSFSGVVPAKKKLIIMGRGGAGKTSMRSLIFSNYTANDTRRLGVTMDVEYSTVKFMGDLSLNIWDCGGQTKYLDSYLNEQKENIFGSVEVLIYVFDLATTNRESEYRLFDECMNNLCNFSPNAKVYCLVHKIDLLPSEEEKIATVKGYKSNILRRTQRKRIKPDVFGTSIWDTTLYQAWSSIVHKLVPNMSKIEENLNLFKETCDASEVVLFERATFLLVCSASPKFEEVQDHQMSFNNEVENYISISGVIKTYRNFCSQLQNPFFAMEIKNKFYTLFIEPFTKSTYILVITCDPNVEPAVTKANIKIARSHFVKLAD